MALTEVTVRSGGDSYSTTIDDALKRIGVAAFSECSSLESVTIPSGVTIIERSAFANCTALISLDIANAVVAIDDAAFYNCPILGDFDLPTSLQRIGKWAFQGCASLSQLSLPAELEVIESGAFADCPGLTSISVAIGNTHFRTVDDVLFSYDLGALLLYPNLRAPMYAIPYGTHSIGYFAFRGCTELLRVTIPESVGNISTGAFSYCGALGSVEIPAGVSKIGNYAFESCHSLSEVTLHEGLEDIGNGAFADCPFLEFNFPQGLKTIGDHAFRGCYRLERITLPDSLERLGSGAFSLCRELKEATFEGRRPFSGLNVFAKAAASDRPVEVYYQDGQLGWDVPFQGLKTLSSTRNWGGYPIVVSETGDFIDTGSWMGWLHISHWPMVWHVSSGTWLYVAESVAYNGNGWVCCLEGRTTAQLQLMTFSQTEWSWSRVLEKWIYLSDKNTANGPSWFFLVL